MFDYTIIHWVTFLGAAVLLNLSQAQILLSFWGKHCVMDVSMDSLRCLVFGPGQRCMS